METILEGASPGQKVSRKRNWLSISAKAWFIATAIGQWFFVLYILGFFGPLFVQSGVDGFRDTHLPNGFLEGDNFGNAALAFHVLVAGLIIAAGQIQLVPAIRAKLPVLHRWSGRFYMAASVPVCLAGIYLTWSRENEISNLIQDIGTTLGGVLVLIFVPLALYTALKRNFAAHRRWALRLFMAVSSVWFLRILIFGWFLIGGGAGIDRSSFTGPFLTLAFFLQTLLPLALLELYFLAENPKNKVIRPFVASLIFAGTAYTAIGVFVITSGFWVPRVLG